MENDFKLDLSHTVELVQSIAANPPRPIVPTFIEEHEQQTREITEQINRMHQERDARENAKLEAVQETARTVAEIRNKQDKIIDNQLVLIDYQKEHIDVLSQQLQILKDIFASGEDGVDVQKEIMQILIEQEENEHPIRALLCDKGADLGVAAITAVVPSVLAAVRMWLAQKGIVIP